MAEQLVEGQKELEEDHKSLTIQLQSQYQQSSYPPLSSCFNAIFKCNPKNRNKTKQYEELEILLQFSTIRNPQAILMQS